MTENQGLHQPDILGRWSNEHREQEKDLPADRSMFMFGHGLEEAVKLHPLLARGMHGVRRVIA
jgi:hypothetical protein